MRSARWYSTDYGPIGERRHEQRLSRYSHAKSTLRSPQVRHRDPRFQVLKPCELPDTAKDDIGLFILGGSMTRHHQVADIAKYLRCLELSPGCTEAEVRRAWRDLARVWHPDRFEGDAALQAKATERLKDINVAYQALSEHLAGGGSTTIAPEDEQRADENRRAEDAHQAEQVRRAREARRAEEQREAEQARCSSHGRCCQLTREIGGW